MKRDLSQLASVKEFLAFDVGAESGRAIRGSLDTGVLTLTEVCRFANGPVRDNGSLRWDIHRVWHEMRRALHLPGAGRLESIGVDAWGCDYGLVRENGSLVERPFTYRDPRTDGVMEEVFTKLSARAHLRDDRYSVPAGSTHCTSCMRHVDGHPTSSRQPIALR